MSSPSDLHRVANTESHDLPNYLKTTGSASFNSTTPFQKRPQKKYNPELNFGVSYESPTYFRTQHTLVNKNSYKNPYLTNPENYDPPTSKLKESKSLSRRNNALSLTQTFKIGEDLSQVEGKVLEKTRLPALKTYNCILDRTDKIQEREIFIQENSSFEADFQKLSKSPKSFHINKGLFGDFVERNNIMNVFGHLLKSERNQTFVDRSKEFTSSGHNSLENTGVKSRNFRNFSNGDVLQNITPKENSLESINSMLNKNPSSSSQLSKGVFLIQNGSRTADLSTSKYTHKKKYKLSEIRTIPFSLTKYLRKFKNNAVNYPTDIERFCEQDQKYVNRINNSILKTKILEALESPPQNNVMSYGTQKIHNLYSEKIQDLEKFEAVSKFYKFLQPLSKRELEKKYKIKEVKSLKLPNKDDVIQESQREDSCTN